MRYFVFLAAMTSFAAAAIDQYCAAFEGPLGGFSPLFKLASPYYETDVVLLHVRDLDDKYRKFVDLDKWSSVDDVYPLHTGPNEAGDTASMLELEAITEKNKTLEFPIMNTTLQAGKSMSYTVPSAGVYCAIAYWRTVGNEPHGVFPLIALTEHEYGDTPLTDPLSISIIACGIAIWGYHSLLIPKLFPGPYRRGELGSLKSTVGSALAGILFLWWIQFAYTFLAINIDGNKNLRPSGLNFNKWLILDHLISLGVTWSVYLFVKGVILSVIDNRKELEPGTLTICMILLFTGLVLTTFTQLILPERTNSGITFTLFVDLSAVLTAIIFSYRSIPSTTPKDDILERFFYSIFKITAVLMYMWATTICAALLSCNRESELLVPPSLPLCFGFVRDSRLSYNHIIMLGYITQKIKTLVFL